jgi:hypothetical protein
MNLIIGDMINIYTNNGKPRRNNLLLKKTDGPCFAIARAIKYAEIKNNIPMRQAFEKEMNIPKKADSNRDNPSSGTSKTAHEARPLYVQAVCPAMTDNITNDLILSKYAKRVVIDAFKLFSNI